MWGNIGCLGIHFVKVCTTKPCILSLAIAPPAGSPMVTL